MRLLLLGIRCYHSSTGTDILHGIVLMLLLMMLLVLMILKLLVVLVLLVLLLQLVLLRANISIESLGSWSNAHHIGVVIKICKSRRELRVCAVGNIQEGVCRVLVVSGDLVG